MGSLINLGNIVAGIVVLLGTTSAWGQTVTETTLRQAPQLSMSMGLTYDSNLQAQSSQSYHEGVLTRLAPRYRINEDYTAVGSMGLSQRFTQENRTDFTNTSLGLTHSLIPLGTLADLRPTISVLLPTNEMNREFDTLRASLRSVISIFARTNTPFIFETGALLQLNSHQFSISRLNGANIQTDVSPYVVLGWTFNDKIQVTTYNSYEYARTYRGTARTNFYLDQSITYIGSRRWNVTVGHNNSGGVLTADGRHSNVDFFHRRSSTVYLSALFNY